MNCLYTGEDFTPRRTNQKFANAKNRMDYHNDRIKKLKKAMASIDAKQQKNYFILLKLMDGRKEASFHKQFLLGKGYSFEVLTHYVVLNGLNRQAIYDFLIYEKDDKVYFKRIY